MRLRLPVAFALAALVGLASTSLPAAFAQQAQTAGQVQPAGAMPGASADKGEADASRPRWSQEDRAAFLDARIAAVHAGLALSPDQEKLWPSVESTIRDVVKQAGDARQKMREQPTSGQTADMDPLARLRRMAEREELRATTLKKIADAAQPLYASLHDDQKRRLHVLMHAIHRHHDHMAMTRWEHDGDRD